MSQAPRRSDAECTQRRRALKAKKMLDIVAGVGERVMRRSQPTPVKAAAASAAAAAASAAAADDTDGTKREAS